MNFELFLLALNSTGAGHIVVVDRDDQTMGGQHSQHTTNHQSSHDHISPKLGMKKGNHVATIPESSRQTQTPQKNTSDKSGFSHKLRQSSSLSRVPRGTSSTTRNEEAGHLHIWNTQFYDLKPHD